MCMKSYSYLQYVLMFYRCKEFYTTLGWWISTAGVIVCREVVCVSEHLKMWMDTVTYI
jgi:hypothetical protein